MARLVLLGLGVSIFRAMRSKISKNTQALKYLVIKAKGATKMVARTLSGAGQQGFLARGFGDSAFVDFGAEDSAVDCVVADSILVAMVDSSGDFDEVALL